MLEECVGDHGHECTPMDRRSGSRTWVSSTFQETKRGSSVNTGCRERRNIISPICRLKRGPKRGEASFQPTLGAVSPTHILPLGIGQHVFGRPRQDIRNVPLAGTAPTGDRPDQFNPDRIHLKVTRDTDGPGQAACREPLTERRAEAVSGICQQQPKRTPAAITRSISASAISGLLLATRCSTGTPARFIRPGLLVQLTQCDHHRNFTALSHCREIVVFRQARNPGKLRNTVHCNHCTVRPAAA